MRARVGPRASSKAKRDRYAAVALKTTGTVRYTVPCLKMPRRT